MALDTLYHTELVSLSATAICRGIPHSVPMLETRVPSKNLYTSIRHVPGPQKLPDTNEICLIFELSNGCYKLQQL